jgi:high-affinity Fe2+/Pb2+ permease
MRNSTSFWKARKFNMPEPISVLLEKYKEHRTQARQHETLRTSIVAFTAAAAGAVLSFAGSAGADRSFKIAASFFLVMLGAFAAMMAYKHYERFRYHSRIAKEYDKKIVQASDKIVNLERYNDIKLDHAKRFGRIVETRAYVGWIVFPSLISVLGLVLLLLQVCSLLSSKCSLT